ncbi:MAG: ABC transporter ATP-binding protein [Chlorobia bacterium]|nr:ABC transporter ATP-binding protein [Fimbriimonadaceae bacterium]
MAFRGAAMTGKGQIHIRNLHKSFALSTSGAGSIKTALLWWKRRSIKKVEVLRGISFEVNPGECVAVVGKNGAGKSTLLSLLARVYKPTSGQIEMKGRTAPLLELGAGFHPDLSGIENIFFNGVILGLTRQEMRDRSQAIIDFSEIGEHIHAPTRTYSSGMLARLGFSVAVHIDADILLVDEVLAVGDYDFERKCYANIDEFRSKGGTILFVSHQMDAVRRVADRCIWLKDGQIHRVGSPDQIIGEYEGRDPDPGLG